MTPAEAAPVLRWAGSKRNLIPELRRALPHGTRYFEPFAGSACLFLALQPDEAVLGDSNHELMDFYRTLRRRPRAISEAVRRWPLDAAAFYRVRALAPESLDAVTRAARFLFLNRLAFNGVYRTNRQGRFNVPFGRQTGAIPSPEKLIRCAVALQRADLRTGDFENTVADASRGDVVYLDPPYTQKPEQAYGVYGYGSFDLRDLPRMTSLLEDLDDRGVSFLFSYVLVPEVAERLRDSWTVHEVLSRSSVAGSVTARRTRREVLISNAEPVG